MSSQTILIVEDDEVIRDVLQQIFQYQGYATEVAIHGKDALQKLGEMQDPPALLLMDLMMPVMNGWELHAELRKSDRWRELPVLIFSAGAAAPELSDHRVRFLKKPLRMNSLLEVVRQLCGQGQALSR